MRLERLEINGFKSFSDRSELAFDKGVTAIVGPNGCGKSNVADAITWVMGEQSAKSLRGDRMEDVIFSGSDARKPTAAAEVRLRFSGVLKSVTAPAFGDEPGPAKAGHHENAGNGHGHVSNGNGNGNGHHPDSSVAPAVDGDVVQRDASDAGFELIQSVTRDVEVTRRLYRSGESEYLIDGQVCRLRDVHDLLMDTGLGAKAYAIIEQGKIGMILSTRPTDRRQLIEEAAGVTKYKARRRAAELKLEAAQQNLTRIDDIVFEVEKQRGTLKRQAGKARRYQKLRDALRRWEKVLFARKYSQLAETIESARGRLAGAREREAAAAARVAEMEADLGRVRIELAESESKATERREAAHSCELSITARQQQIAFDKDQIQALGARAETMTSELALLDARREPAQALIAERRAAAAAAIAERELAAATMASRSDAYDSAHRGIEGLEADVEAARSEVFSAINAATALRHSLEHAAAARERVAETLAKLQIEGEDLRIERERVSGDHASASEGLRQARAALDATHAARLTREAELATARPEHERRARAVRTREQELAGLEARLASLEELEAARAEYGDAARTVLAEANGRVGQRGAVADYLEVDRGFERAVEACLGDLLQHVIVERAEQAEAGFELLRDRSAGRCGFLIVGESGELEASGESPSADGLVALTSVARASGPFTGAIRETIGEAWIADSFARAIEVSRTTALPVATISGELFKRASLVTGGSPREARGILETKRDIRDLRDRIDNEQAALAALLEEVDRLEAIISEATTEIDVLNGDQHAREKAIVALEAQLQWADAERIRLAQKQEQLDRERSQAEEERESLDRRQQESREAIARLEEDQRSADERLTAAQRCLFEARESAEDLSRRAADAGASHAALVERAAALTAEVQRLEEAAAELELRASALSADLGETRRRVEGLCTAVFDAGAALDADVRVLDALRLDVREADDFIARLRTNAADHEAGIKISRAALDGVRSEVAELDIQRATAESDLSHLSQSCIDAVQTTLDDVLSEVAAQEASGQLTPEARIVCADEPADDETDEMSAAAAASREGEAVLTAEDAIASLRGKIDRLGPVNMMAIEQFDELETRHAFLSTQRKDLVDSITQTSQAIKRIDETTRSRFADAFSAINRNFQETFSTLFGGGRAGLTLLDENDPLESGIEIIAQPPGKRLQSVQLLSGGEKALTAIALMFGLFRYKPSPFCLLDEIDAPLDDANIGRFVEMLRGMLSHTQFILITHNRKTMEIADRLYGVTMEEPGVSKLISVQLN
jgi:chromosome segregation protein